MTNIGTKKMVYRPFFVTRDETKFYNLYSFIHCFSLGFPNFEFSENIGPQLLPYITRCNSCPIFLTREINNTIFQENWFPPDGGRETVPGEKSLGKCAEYVPKLCRFVYQKK